MREIEREGRCFTARGRLSSSAFVFSVIVVVPPGGRLWLVSRRENRRKSRGERERDRVRQEVERGEGKTDRGGRGGRTGQADISLFEG